MKYELERADYSVSIIRNEVVAYDERYSKYDLIILDMQKSSKQEMELCRKIVNVTQCLIMILSPHSEEDDVVSGLDAGGDDYILKPIREREFIARVNALMRRKKQQEHKTKYCFSEIIIDLDMKEVHIKNEKIPLSRNEFRICELLVENAGRTLTKDYIYNKLYPIESDTQFRTVTEYIYSIRKKFKIQGYNPIRTIWGVGYRWNTDY